MSPEVIKISSTFDSFDFRHNRYDVDVSKRRDDVDEIPMFIEADSHFIVKYPKQESAFTVLNGLLVNASASGTSVVKIDRLSESHDSTLNMERHPTLQKYSLFMDNWDGYGAISPSHLSIYRANYFINISEKNGVKPSHIGPSAKGGISIKIENGGIHYIIEFYNDGDIVLLNKNESDVFVVELSPKNLVIAAENISNGSLFQHDL